jgi:putative drug exporter of the RND superfamily
MDLGGVMSNALYRVGRVAYERPAAFVAAWLLVLTGLAGWLWVSPPQLSNELRISGTPAQDVIDDLAVAMPGASGGQGLLAFQAPRGTLIDEGDNRAALLAAVDRVYRRPHVIDARQTLREELVRGLHGALVSAGTAFAAEDGAAPATTMDGEPTQLVVDGWPLPGVIVSADRTAALLQFQFDAQTFELPPGTVAETVEAAQDAVRARGIAVLPSSAMVQVPEVFGVGEVVGVAVAGLVLLLTLGSLVAAGLPLITALLGVAVGLGGTFAFAGVFSLHSTAAVLAVMLGLSVGIDYALFVVNRQRQLILERRLRAAEAAARSVATAGTAVVFAGSTVIIALAAIAVVGIPLLTGMAFAASVAVAVAVAVSLTLLPALLGLVGERVCTPRARARAERRTDPGGGSPLATAWVRLLIRGRYVAILLAVGATAALAVPAATMQLGLPAGAGYDTGTPQRRSYDVVADRFGPGYNGPLLAVVRATDPQRAVPVEDLLRVRRELRGLEGVDDVGLAGMHPSGTTALLMVIPSTGPNDVATARLVHDIREQAGGLATERDLELGVTGFTALGIDVSDRIADVLPVYLAIVVGLSMLVLLLVFRSLVVPVLATAGFVLSVLATFGATTAVFQWGWLQGALGLDAEAPILSLLPVIVAGVLYGLAMDYQVFLGTSTKEAHRHGRTGVAPVEQGFRQAGRVVAAAAVIMTSVFAGFVFSPEPMVRQIGFALGIGVLIDAFVIRMTLVPAVMAVLRDRAWWLPGWLDRILPDLDVDGDDIRRQAPTTPSPGSSLTEHREELPSPH